MNELERRQMIDALYDGDIDRLKSLNPEPDYVADDDRWTLLHLALVSVSKFPKPEMIQFLIEHGVDVNALDQDNWAPLHFAARTKNAEVITLLLDAGAAIDAENDEGCTPLRITLLQKPFSLEATEILLARGADSDHRPNDNAKSVYEFAQIISHGDDAWLLELFERYRDLNVKSITRQSR